MSTIKFDLSEFLDGSVYYGRMNGLSLRKKLDLDQKDDEIRNIVFTVPSGVESINPSFYLGFLQDSIKKLGIEKFDQKYRFELKDDNEQVLNLLKNNLKDGRKYAILELNSWNWSILKNNNYG